MIFKYANLKHLNLFFVIIIAITCAAHSTNQFIYENDECSVFKYYFSPPLNSQNTKQESQKHKLAIVVPFRDRFDELLDFIPAISNYLNRKNIDFKIYIINQMDDYRFNRASLINIGFLYSMKECDYMAMHDVDLIPLNSQLDYNYPLNGPYHVASPDLHPRYNYKNFIGGIFIISRKDFIKLNGMSNKFFGWGREDDEFFMRLMEAKLNLNRPNKNKIRTDSTNTFRHNHCPVKRRRDGHKYPKQKDDGLRRDFDTGLDTLQYRIIDTNTLNIDNHTFTVVNVKLYCNKIYTPWCEHEFQFL